MAHWFLCHHTSHVPNESTSLAPVAAGLAEDEKLPRESGSEIPMAVWAQANAKCSKELKGCEHAPAFLEFGACQKDYGSLRKPL